MNAQFDSLFALSTAWISSFAMCVLILLSQSLHSRYSMDFDVRGIQKFHSRPVPRIGGLAVIIGLLTVPSCIAFLSGHSALHQYKEFMFYAILAAVPAFAAGLVEDLTKTVSVRTRLIATFISALLGAWLLGAALNRVDVIGLDFLLGYAPFSLIVTAIAVSGVANSINIIDGFNGIATGTVTVLLGGIAFLAYESDDFLVFNLCLMGIGAALGFMALNFPTGRLFMGDGGAYLLGFWVAEMAVLLVVRNVHVTAWQVLAICAYPVTEVLFSIYRRKVIRKVAAGAPDRLHLHTLIYRRFICNRLPANQYRRHWVRNAAVACILVPWLAFATIVSVVYGKSIPGAFVISFLQVFLYLAVYGRLVRGHWCFRPTVLLGLRREIRERPV